MNEPAAQICVCVSVYVVVGGRSAFEQPREEHTSRVAQLKEQDSGLRKTSMRSPTTPDSSVVLEDLYLTQSLDQTLLVSQPG